jgi:malonyl CoA-acyl carrier protein transacylase
LSLEALPDERELKNIMAAQLSRPVLWVDLIKKLSMNSKLFVEVGPGATLFRTVRWINRNIEIMNTTNNEKLSEVIDKLT